MRPDAPRPRASYADVKSAIREAIEHGGWKPGFKLPSERELVEQFKYARMTVRRALQELQAEGLIQRRHGSGSYVADLQPISNILSVKDIREEIAARGHKHSSTVLLQTRIAASQPIADAMLCAVDAPVFCCQVLHSENGMPIQFEERFVNPEVVPDFLSLDLTAQTASGHLFERAPLTAAEQVVEAVNADAQLAAHLRIAAGDALLRVSRRTLSQGRVASIARLYHPGASYRLIGVFSAGVPESS